MRNQLDLFGPKPDRKEWQEDEVRGLVGRIGTATIAIRVQRTKDGFRWRGEFNTPVFGTSLQWSRDLFETDLQAFAQAGVVLRDWLRRNRENQWEKRFVSWIEAQSAFDLAARVQNPKLSTWSKQLAADAGSNGT